MTSSEIRQKFLDFFVLKGHTQVPSSSLIPDDSSVLLTTAGMQQFKSYYSELDSTTAIHPSIGKPVGKNACSVQKCFRTSDIDEVGDERHLTMFEMLGNFSFGGYFKKEAIEYAHEFITKVMGLPISYVTVFKGSEVVPKDQVSKVVWYSLGVTDIREQDMEDVFWGPTGNGGPCGPCTEIYCRTSDGKDIEVWNIVFNEYLCSGSRESLFSGEADLSELKTPGVDTGMGLERLAISSQGVSNVYETDAFRKVFGSVLSNSKQKSARIVADHLRSAAFLLTDGIIPSNKDRGYILRRIIRRLVMHSRKIGLNDSDLLVRMNALVAEYGDAYPEMELNFAAAKAEFQKEYDKFSETLVSGLSRFKKLFVSAQKNQRSFFETMAKGIFDLYQSDGMPFDASLDLLAESAPDFDRANLQKRVAELFATHQQISKAGAEGKFGGHGLVMSGELKAGNEEDILMVTRLHTATHLLHAALRKVLGKDVKQMGSDITPERLRFDFAFPSRLSPQQLSEIEKIVNNEIKKGDRVIAAEMNYDNAIKTGALAFFRGKYPEKVKVYSIGDFSKEVCGGPHVENTAVLGNFKITKEEAVSAGVRRIRATVS